MGVASADYLGLYVIQWEPACLTDRKNRIEPRTSNVPYMKWQSMRIFEPRPGRFNAGIFMSAYSDQEKA